MLPVGYDGAYCGTGINPVLEDPGVATFRRSTPFFPCSPLWRVPLSAFLFAALFLLEGCGLMAPSVKPIGKAEAPAVRAAKESVVLFRLAPRLDNALVAPAGDALEIEGPLRILWADIDRREAPRSFRAFSPSAEAAAGNWIYYLVSPGVYWVGIPAPFTAKSRKNSYFLEVPEGVPLIYAGTVAVSCKGRWGLFGTQVDRCDHVVIEDETDAARIVAARDLGGLGSMETALLVPSTGAAVKRGPGELAPMRVLVKGPRSPSTPAWRKRGVGRAVGLGGGGDLLTELERYGGPEVVLLVPAYLLYLPVGTAAGLIGGEQSSRKWGPCMNTIAAEVVDWSPRDAFRVALVESLAGRGIDNVAVLDNVAPVPGEGDRPRLRTLFEIEIQEVAFRECRERWTFCGEMKVRGRLRDLARGRVLYDGTIVYSNGSGRSPLLAQPDRWPYERIEYGGAPCRPIEEYCVPGGEKAFVEALGTAARFLAERLVEEAGVAQSGRGSPASP